MRKTKRLIACLLLMVVCISFSMQSIHANAEVDDASVNLKIIYKYDQTAISGAEFDIYRVADIDQGCNFTLVDEFKNYPVDVNLSSSDYSALAKTLYGYVLLDDLDPTDSGKTNSDGVVKFSTFLHPLKQGLYLVVPHRLVTADYIYSAEPYMVSLPNFNSETNEFEYSVVSLPKCKRTVIVHESDTDSSENDTESENSETPSTNSDNTPSDTSGSHTIVTDTDTVYGDSEETVTTDTTETNTDKITTDTTDTNTEKITTDTNTDKITTDTTDTNTDKITTDTNTDKITTDTTDTNTDKITTDTTDTTDTNTDKITTDTTDTETDTIDTNSDVSESDSDSSDSETTMTDTDGSIKDEFISISVLKQWDDEGYEDKRAESVEVYLLKDGEVYDTVILSEENNWYYKWENLDKYSEWLVVEKPVDGYTVLVHDKDTAFVIVNTYSDKTVKETDVDTNSDNSDTPNKSSDSDSSKPSLPQTGTLWWCVPILLALGFVLYLVGHSLRREDYEK